MKPFYTFLAVSILSITTTAFALAADEIATASQPAYISGGVGADEVASMKEKEKDYNFKALFVRADGAFLADVNVKVTDKKGNSVIDTATEGPILLAQLKPGRYTITATTKSDQKTITRKINIAAGKKLNNETFRYPAEKEVVPQETGSSAQGSL